MRPGPLVRDLTGETYGQWTVLSLWPRRNKFGQVMWLCRCTCGTQKPVLFTHLRSGNSLRCRPCAIAITKKSKEVNPPSGKRTDLTGNVYGSWTVIEFSHRSDTGSTYWNCRCACGTEKALQGPALRRGRTTRCMDCRNRAYRGVNPKARTTGKEQS